MSVLQSRPAVELGAARGRGVLAVLVLVGLSMTGCAAAAVSAGGGSGDAPVGTWSESDAAESPNLTLEEDGTVSGFDGCNRLVGTWEATDDGVSFGTLGSTMMFCDGVDTWLSGATTATIDGGTMTVNGPAGRSIGTLERE